MKRIILFFAVCLGLSVFQTDVVCGATAQKTQSKRNSATVVTTTQRSGTTQRQKNEQNRSTKARSTQPKSTVSRSTGQVTQQTRSTTPEKQAVVSRTAKKTTSTTRQSSGATKPSTVSRIAISQKNSPMKVVSTRAATSAKMPTVSRATALNNEKLNAIKTKNYTKCKTVYNECMDEFCANKDANLRRCACSSRIHEFDNIKKQLSQASDKMTDFNQRLLIVSMDKEDAEAITKASEGEEAFNTKDKSESEKLLQKIVNSLNGSGDSKLDSNLSSISLSLDVDGAWDTVDSLAGASTTSKSGTDLYNAAQPVCVEMAQEVCTKEELNIAQSSYSLLIQQDCDTVAKSYQTQYNQTKDKILESSALLDMSRLNAYQQRNSDDILTCKKKILEQLSDDSVCGQDLYKCLDTSGQYINPSTGEAFLSQDLYKMTELLTAPSGNLTWSKMPQNEKFVSFLNSKKSFLKTATEQCQDLSEVVWKDFLDDALAQIKIAQNKKLETLRQSCTTLVAECKTDKMKDLSDFDSRALSSFSVLADTTVNEMCSNVQDSCASLLAHSGDIEEMWNQGMTQIATDVSYEKILETCMTAGKDCIIRQCNGTSGNFALCGDYTSVQRRSILKRDVCWDEIEACIKQSGNLDNINLENVGISTTSTYCDTEAGKECFITEKIWGGCEHDAENTAINTASNCTDYDETECQSNKIIMPTEEESQTLLAWFAHNTSTTTSIDSCSAYKCPINYSYDSFTNKCYRFAGEQTDVLGGTPSTTDEIIQISSNIRNYCPGGHTNTDMYGNCCINGIVNGVVQPGAVSDGICVPNSNYFATYVQTTQCDTENRFEIGDSTSDDTTPFWDNEDYLYYCPIKLEIEDTATTNTKYYGRVSYAKTMDLYCIS